MEGLGRSMLIAPCLFFPYKERGFLPESIINFLGLLGWHPTRGTFSEEKETLVQEIFDIDELIKHFSLSKLKTNPSIVDESKLLWMNRHYFSQKLQADTGLNQVATELQTEVCKIYR